MHYVQLQFIVLVGEAIKFFLEMWKVNTKKSEVSTSSTLSTPPKTASPLQAATNAKKANLFNFYDCVKPIYRTGRFVGLLPFTLNYTSNGEIDSCSLSLIDIFWFVISIVICITFSLLGYLKLTPTQDTRTTILLIGGRLLVISGVFLAGISTIIDMFNRHRLVKLVKAINSFDQEVIEAMIF